MRRYLHRLATVLGSLLIICGALVTGLTPTLAAPRATDSLVVIAQDITSLAHCITGLSTTAGTVISPASPCPAGTVISTKQVPLSQALAEHEAYVLLPSSKPTSSTEIAKISQQVDDMVSAKVRQIRQQAAATFSPQVNLTPATCGASGLFRWADWSPDFDSNSSFYVSITWNVNGNCTITWVTSYMDLLSVGGPTYWNDDQYAGSSADYGCASLNSGANSRSPISWGLLNQAPAGYDYLQEVYNGSNCFPWDSSDHTVLGPITTS